MSDRQDQIRPDMDGRNDAGLDLSPPQMRSLGYRAVDIVVDHFARIADDPVVPQGAREPIARLFDAPPPDHGSDPVALLDWLRDNVFANALRTDHPRFFGYIPSPNNFVSAIGDLLASGFNVFAGLAPTNHGPTELELAVIRWLCDLLGLPTGAGGLIVSGGSMANFTALAVARHRRLGDTTENAVIYVSDQTHSSIERAVRALGFGADQLAVIASDADYRIDLDVLAERITQDRADGRRPFCVVGTAGTTNTGAIDALDRLALLCRHEDLWFHVDGAYGAAAAILPEMKAAFAGLSAVDSLSIDPHKWLFQPFECGCLLVRDRRWLPETFRIVPDYMKDSDVAGDMVNFRDWSLQTTRAFKALKLWMTFKTFGMNGIRTAIRHGLDLGEFTQGFLEARDGWQVVSPASLGAVTFRYIGGPPEGPDCDALNQAMVNALSADGFALVSTTILEGRKVIRICALNPRATRDDIRRTVEKLEELARV